MNTHSKVCVCVQCWSERVDTGNQKRPHEGGVTHTGILPQQNIVGDKMSKSLNNSIGLTESPDSMFGKFMSIQDGVMWRWFELLSFRPEQEIIDLRVGCEKGIISPMIVKMQLAREIITRFHSKEAADNAEKTWSAQFQKKEIPADIQIVELGSQPILLIAALVTAGLTKSNGESRRLIAENAVTLNDNKVTDIFCKLECGEHIVKVGKRRWAKLQVR